jgi:hypothetical protein
MKLPEGIEQFTEEKALATVRSYLASQKWWMFIAIDPTGDQMMEKIEKQYYSGPKAADFQLLIVLVFGTTIAIGFGKKEHLTPQQLSRFQKETGTLEPATTKDLEKRDILFLLGNSYPTILAISIAEYLNVKIGPIGKLQ